MTTERLRDETRVTERWNRVFGALSSEPRRQLIVSLNDTPDGEVLPLPDAATSPTVEDGPERLHVHLRHRHLPMLEDVGYVRWRDDPFSVERGPHFEEVAVVFDALYREAHNIPDHLVAGFHRLEREREERSDD